MIFEVVDTYKELSSAAVVRVASLQKASSVFAAAGCGYLNSCSVLLVLPAAESSSAELRMLAGSASSQPSRGAWSSGSQLQSLQS